MRPYTSGRPTDNPPQGGSKSKELGNVIPFVAEPVDDSSVEDMRNNLDRQLKRIAEVTLAFKNKLDSIPVTPPPSSSPSDFSGVEGRLNKMEIEVKELKEMISTLISDKV